MLLNLGPFFVGDAQKFRLVVHADLKCLDEFDSERKEKNHIFFICHTESARFMLSNLFNSYTIFKSHCIMVILLYIILVSFRQFVVRDAYNSNTAASSASSFSRKTSDLVIRQVNLN